MGCSPCCLKKFNKSTQVSPVPSAAPKHVKHVGTLTKIPMNDVALQTKLVDPPPPPPPGHGERLVIKAEKVDGTPLDEIARMATFDSEVNGPIVIDIVDRPTGRQLKPGKPKAQDNQWDEKYFIHGEFTEIVARLKSETHGCIVSSIPEDIERYFYMLHTLNIRAMEIYRERNVEIATKEKKKIEEITLRCDVINEQLTNKGRSYASQYDDYYRKLIEEFIRKIEIEMSVHFDQLQQDLQNDRDKIFNQATKNVHIISDKADQARKAFYLRLQQYTLQLRQVIMADIDNLLKGSAGQSLGFEQLRKITLDFYAIVGNKGTIVCENIQEREKYAKDITHMKQHQPQMKRTVFLSKDIGKS